MPKKKKKIRMRKKKRLVIYFTGTVTYSLLANMAFTIALRDFEFRLRHNLAHFTQVNILTSSKIITPATMEVLINPKNSS